MHMRIAFDHHVFGLHEYSGISRYLHEVASQIASTTTHQVGIVAPFYVNKYLRNAPAELHIAGIPVPKVRRTGRAFRAANNLLARPLLTRFKPDVVHETDYSAQRFSPRNAKIILTVHDMIHERLPECFAPGDATASNKKLAVARADHVICVSENTRRDLVELLNVPQEKTSVVHHGFSLSGSHGNHRFYSAPGRPFLLYVGTRLRYKNFDGLVKAFAASPLLHADFDLVCFGGGPFSREEQDLFARAHMPATSVRQVSGSDAVLSALYCTAHAFVYPSHYEGFGIPPLEAMAFDCPVACSNTSSIPEVVGDAALLFDPDDIESMLSALETLVGDDELRRSLLVRGRGRIAHFSWNRCAQETLKVYESVGGMRGP